MRPISPNLGVIGLLGSSSDKTFSRLLLRANSLNYVYEYLDFEDLIRIFVENDIVGSFLSLRSYFIERIGKCNSLYFRLPSVDYFSHDSICKVSANRLIIEIYSIIAELKDILIVSLPEKNFNNSCKILHGIDIVNVGIKYDICVPASIFTNSIDDLKLFCCKYPETIVKGGSADKSECCRFDVMFVENWVAQHGFLAPLLVQERILGYDVRVHAIRGACVAEIFVTPDVDYRFSKTKRSFICELPLKVRTFIFDLCERRDLQFAGIDFRIDASGRWYVLEINSMPDFYGYDVRANHKICDALLSMLADKKFIAE